MSFKMDMASGTIIESASPQQHRQELTREPLPDRELQLQPQTPTTEPRSSLSPAPQWLAGMDLAALLERMKA